MDANDQAEQEKEKEDKIKEFQNKLTKIRNAALFLDEMTQMHDKDIKKRKIKSDEITENQRFLEEQIMQQRIIRQKNKAALSKQGAEFDLLYAQAQKFI